MRWICIFQFLQQKTFGGVYYYMHGRFALYYQECLRRNLLPRIRGAFFYHGFSPVDASKVLKLVIGFSQKRSMQFKGPIDFSIAGWEV